MSNTLGSLVVELGANLASLQSDFARAQSITDKAIGDINLKINSIGSSANFSGVSSKVQGLTGDFNSLRNTIAGLVGLDISIGGLEKLAGLADDYQNVSNRIRTTVSDSQQLIAVQDQVFAISQQTARSLDDTAKTYQRIEQALVGAGVAQAEAQSQALAATKTLNQEIVISGASASEASHAIMDLMHGLAGGVIQTRQFNQVMRQMPDLAQQVADGLGVSVKRLEEMVHNGLPAQQLLQALANQAGEIDDKFNALPKTFAQTWTILANSVEVYVGRAAQASSITDTLKSGIVTASEHIDALAIGAQAVGVAMASWLGGRSLLAIGSIAAGLKDLVLAQGAYKTATLLSAESDLKNAAATQTSITATLASAKANETAKLAALDRLAAEKAALSSSIAANQALAASIEAQGSRAIGAYEAITAAKAQIVAIDAGLIEAESALTAAEARVVLAADAEAAASARVAASKAALTAAQVEATGATAVFGRIGSGVLAMLGGWPTIVFAAGAALIYFWTQETEAAKRAELLAKAADGVARAHRELTPEARASAQAMLDASEAQMGEAIAAEATAKRNVELARSMTALPGAAYLGFLVAAQHEATKASDAVAAMQAAQERMNTAFKFNAVVGWATEIEGSLHKVEQRFLDLAVAGSHVLSMFGLNVKVQNDYDSSLARGNQALKDAADAHEEHAKKLQKEADTYKLTNVGLVQYQIKQDLATIAARQGFAATEAQTKAVNEAAAADLKAAAVKDQVVAAHKVSAKAIEGAREAFQKYIDTLNTAGLGKFDKEFEQYVAHIDKAHDLYVRARQDGISFEEATRLETDALNANNDALARQDNLLNAGVADALNKITLKYREQIDGLKGVTREQEIERQYLKDLAEFQAAWTEAMGKGVPVTEEMKQRIHDLAVAHTDEIDAAKRAADVEKQWQSIAVSGFNSVGNSIAQFATGGIKTWHDFGQSLIGDAKQFIAAIIEQFLKLAVFNDLINNLFHLSGSSQLPSFANMAMGAGGSAGGASLGGSSPVASGLFSPSSWTSAGNNLFGGFQSAMEGAGNLWSKATGAYTYSSPIMTGPSSSLAGEGASGAFTGAQASGSFGAPAYGGYGSALGQGIGIFGGAVAGYNEYKAAGGGAGGVAGGVAYGVGTYFAGAAISAGLGAAAVGGLSAGMAAGMAAIPVVGWIALAAMAINMISGGKLFGTAANKFVSGASTETITATGADIDTKATYKGQRALFGGSYYKTKDIPVSAEAEKAADDFFAALKKGQTEFVAFFGDTLKDQVDIVGGTFTTTFDKHGKATGTSDTVLGVTRKETDQQFAERLQADSYLAVLDKMGIGASAFVSSLQDDADKLFAGVQDLASVAQNAFVNIGKGFTFMALGANAALPEVMKFVIGLNQGGETLSQTYQRLMQAQAQYDQFVGQFKPATQYVDPLEASLSNLYHKMLDAQQQANALAVAAGADGASLTDLSNISKTFASQMAQAVVQLEASAQQLAFSLGLTLMGSLDQINAEIQQLTGADTATSSITNFGNAITETAHKADAALNLLLGNLSPLNDQEKLQIALQGLRAGTVSADQVLTIGRSLYASSQAYTDLFNQVTSVAGHQSTGGGGGGNGGSSSSSQSHQLSQADQDKLNALIKERDGLQAAQTLAQYQTLARQIEEIAQAKGETFEQVIKEMGIDQAALEKGLGIKSDADFAAYMDQMQKQLDSAGENTTSIVNAINSGTQQLVLAITGKSPVNPHDISTLSASRTSTDGTPLGTRSFTNPGAAQPGMKAGRMISDEDAKAIGQAFYDAGVLLDSRAMAGETRGQRSRAFVR